MPIDTIMFLSLLSKKSLDLAPGIGNWFLERDITKQTIRKEQNEWPTVMAVILSWAGLETIRQRPSSE
jgi:hypothetical protein